MVIEIIVGVIALFFAALVIYAIIMLRNLNLLLKNVSFTLNQFQSDSKELISETHTFLKKNTEIAADVNTKLSKIDPLIELFGEIGNKGKQAMHPDEMRCTCSYCEYHHPSSHPSSVQKIEEIIELVGLGFKAYQQFKGGMHGKK